MKVNLIDGDKEISGSKKIIDPDSEVDKFMSGYDSAKIIKEVKPEESEDSEIEESEDSEIEDSPQPQKKVIDNDIINGLTLITLIDMVLPSLIVFAYQKINKKNKIKIPPQKISLTRPQLKKLEPLADEVAKQIKFNEVNPILLLVISMGSMYYLNMATMIHEFELHEKADKKE